VLNHVAVRVDSSLLDEPSRSEIMRFFHEIFGWVEGDNTGERNDPLIMYTGVFAQFIYLARGDPDSLGGDLDHFGLQIDTLAELEALVAKAQEIAARDPRVTVTPIGSRTTEGPTHDFTLTSAYIGFTPPFTVELQHLHREERRSQEPPR
jgi:hypothetical protein